MSFLNSIITKHRMLLLVEIMLLNCKSAKSLSIKSIMLLTTGQICAKMNNWRGITERGAGLAYHC